MQRKTSLTQQVKDSAEKEVEPEKKYDGTDTFISTGSTLLDLAISGGRVRGGGIPGGIMIEIFGPSACGKTSLLCEIAGNVQRSGGEIAFNDPEGRLNKQFARIFDLNPDEMTYAMPNTVPELFKLIRNWEPKSPDIVNGVFADSLAALSTDMEMDNEDGDKMGMRRAKEFSEQLRKTCRLLVAKNLLLVCSNQQRVNAGAGPYMPQFLSPGGEAIGFYSSLRLRCMSPQKIKDEITVSGKKIKKVIGVDTKIEVHKSSVWKPYREAQVCIIFDYGIDDVRANLQYIKSTKGHTVYQVGEQNVGKSIKDAIYAVETDNLETALKEEVIDLWMEIEEKFNHERKPKAR